MFIVAKNISNIGQYFTRLNVTHGHIATSSIGIYFYWILFVERFF